MVATDVLDVERLTDVLEKHRYGHVAKIALRCNGKQITFRFRRGLWGGWFVRCGALYLRDRPGVATAYPTARDAVHGAIDALTAALGEDGE